MGVWEQSWDFHNQGPAFVPKRASGLKASRRARLLSKTLFGHVTWKQRRRHFCNRSITTDTFTRSRMVWFSALARLRSLLWAAHLWVFPQAGMACCVRTKPRPCSWSLRTRATRRLSTTHACSTSPRRLSRRTAQVSLRGGNTGCSAAGRQRAGSVLVHVPGPKLRVVGQ